MSIINIKQTLPEEEQSLVDQILLFIDRVLTPYFNYSEAKQITHRDHYLNLVSPLLIQLAEIYKKSSTITFEIEGLTHIKSK